MTSTINRPKGDSHMKKHFFITSFIALLISSNANAEFVLGGDVSYASNTAKRDDGFARAADELGSNSSSFGVFGQYIFAAQPSDAGFGVHVGYATESGDVSRGGGEVRTSYFSFENTFDILGVYRTAEFGKGWSGLVMLGYSRREMEFGYKNITGGNAVLNGQNDSATHTGYKIAAGVQKIFRDSWSMQAQVQYADYGKEDYGPFTEVNGPFEGGADMTSLGLRIGVARHF